MRVFEFEYLMAGHYPPLTDHLYSFGFRVWMCVWEGKGRERGWQAILQIQLMS